MGPATELLNRLLATLTTVEQIQNRLDPSRLAEYQQRLKSLDGYEQIVAVIRGLVDEQVEGRQQLLKVAEQLSKGLELFHEADGSQAGIFKAYRSTRFFCRALDALYPLAHTYDQVNRFFLYDSMQADGELAQRLTANPPDDEIKRGVINAQNQRGQRGGFHLYVPEYYTKDKSWPIIIALHGGSGHGADFFWSWLRDARSRGCLLLSASSKGNTWSLHQPAVDTASLMTMLKYVKDNWQIDESRVLLTGISDGGTFAFLAAMANDTPFTHLAPVACAAHAFVGQVGVTQKYKDRPIYLVHGARDWMFPVVPIREAADELKEAGAEITYREIEDLSHNYPQDENANILDWFLGD